MVGHAFNVQGDCSEPSCIFSLEPLQFQIDLLTGQKESERAVGIC